MTLQFAVEGRTRHMPVWLPDDTSTRGDWPLIVFLHAYEERGDNFEHLAVGIGPALEARPDLYRCVVILPQCPKDLVWTTSERPWAAGFGDASAHIDAAIDAAVTQLPVAPDRVALTGASMGGYGTFHYGAARADRFRAFGPVCGGGTADLAASLATHPVWAWHGTNDDVVPITESQAMISSLQSAGARNARLTEVEGHGHDVWDVAYQDPEFVAFLLS